MNKKVVLFRGCSYTGKGRNIALLPLPLLSLSSNIKQYESIILDGNVKSYKELFESIKSSLDDIFCIGISALTGPEVATGVEFAKLIRSIKPNIPIVWGGVACLCSAKTIFAKFLC